MSVSVDATSGQCQMGQVSIPLGKMPSRIANLTNHVSVTVCKPDACEEEVWVNTNEKQNWLSTLQSAVSSFCKSNRKLIRYCMTVLLVIGYFIYFGFAIRYDLYKSSALVAITGLVLVCIFYVVIRERFGDVIYRHVAIPLERFLNKIWPSLRWVVYPLLVVGIGLYLCVVITKRIQLQSIIGLIACLTIPFLTCKHPTQIRWRPVLWGMALQFILGVAVLRWKPGYIAVDFAATEINKFLSYSLAGSALAFGDPTFLFHPLFMMTLPLIIYIGAVTGLLYYMGWMQTFTAKMGFLMRHTLGTTGIESVSIALNIFLSVGESVQLLRPYIPKLTMSEMHTLLVGCHATIAGFAFALFIMVGVDAHHLLTAAVMSAPAAVAIAKLNYPETEPSYFINEDNCKLEKSSDANAADAMSRGAWEAGRTCATILVQLIAFFSIFAFLDSVIAYFGSLIGIELSFEILMAYIFTPVAYMIGIAWEECPGVASVLGMKLTFSEMLAYFELGKINRAGSLSVRSITLTTYAICGFSSVGTIAMFGAVWGTVDPRRSSEISAILPRVYVNTNLACMITACIVGILWDENSSFEGQNSGPAFDVGRIMGMIPSYDRLLDLVGFFG